MARCSCRHMVVPASNLPVCCVDLPTQCFLFRWSGDFQAPSAARDQGFHPVGFRLQMLSWVKFVRCVWQTGDLVVDSESAFSVDKLHHKDTVSVWVVSRRNFLCYFQAGPASVSHVLVLFLCLRVGSLSPFFLICSSDCTALWPDRISLCHVTAISLFGAVLSCHVLLVAVQKVLTALP